MQNQHKSYWELTVPQGTYPKLTDNQSFDVIIIGAGMTGLSTALMLKKSGLRVAVVEQNQVGSGDSGHTTAHLTEVLDTRYYQLIDDFGLAKAQIAADASRAAIDCIDRTAKLLEIDCDFLQVPAYLYAERESEVKNLYKELDAQQKLGIEADWTFEIPLPFPTKGGIRIAKQAQFHPTKYLNALATAIHGNGSAIFENTHVIDIQDGSPCRVVTRNGSLQSENIIVATNSVTVNRFILQTKVAAYRTYAIGTKLANPLPQPGLFWDAGDPYHYIRQHGDIVIIGGEDHKTGKVEHTENCYEKLKAYANQHFHTQAVPYEWSGQILEPVDGLPYIGLNPGSKHVYISVGYSGNGMTFSTVGALLMSDLIVSQRSPWKEVFDPARITPIASASEFVQENVDFPLCYIRDRITTPTVDSLDGIKSGEGKTVRFKGQILAVYRENDQRLTAVTATCPHMGCLVHFNDAEKTWDCPCHGSRFDTQGEVLNGPALEALKPVDVTPVSEPPTPDLPTHDLKGKDGEFIDRLPRNSVEKQL